MKKYDCFCSFCGKGLMNGQGKIKKFSSEDFYRLYCEVCHIMDFPEWSEQSGYMNCPPVVEKNLLKPAYDNWGFKIKKGC